MSRPVPAETKIEPAGEAGAAADAEPQLGIALDVVHEAGDWPNLDALIAAIHAASDAVARELRVSGCSACVALSSDEEVARLNAAYRGKPAPTNVLSFPAQAVPEGTRFLGDIGLAAETVAREAHEQATPFVDHLQHLVVHGLLHLKGYDHQTPAEAEAMEALEVRILAALGVADPYAGGELLPS